MCAASLRESTVAVRSSNHQASVPPAKIIEDTRPQTRSPIKSGFPPPPSSEKCRLEGCLLIFYSYLSFWPLQGSGAGGGGKPKFADSYHMDIWTFCDRSCLI